MVEQTTETPVIWDAIVFIVMWISVTSQAHELCVISPIVAC